MGNKSLAAASTERVGGPSRPLVDPTFLSGGRPPRFQQDPLSNRACRFASHGLPVVSCVAALRRPRVLDGSPQTVQPEGVEENAVHLLGVTHAKSPPLALPAG